MIFFLNFYKNILSKGKFIKIDYLEEKTYFVHTKANKIQLISNKLKLAFFLVSFNQSKLLKFS